MRTLPALVLAGAVLVGGCSSSAGKPGGPPRTTSISTVPSPQRLPLGNAFDIGRPVPGEDAALVVVAFLKPAETSAEKALAAIAQRAEDAGAKVAGTGSAKLRISGGAGPLVTRFDSR